MLLQIITEVAINLNRCCIQCCIFTNLNLAQKSVFGCNFRQNLAFHEFHDFSYSNFRKNLGFSCNFSAQNCLWKFSTKFVLIYNFTQNFSVAILKKYVAKKHKKRHLRKFGKYIVYNVLRLKNMAKMQHQAFTNITKTLN